MTEKSKWEHDYDDSALSLRYTSGHDGVFDILNKCYPEYVSPIANGIKQNKSNKPIVAWCSGLCC